MIAAIEVAGSAHGQGSKKIVTPRKRTPRGIVKGRPQMIENDPGLKPWRDRIAVHMRRTKPEKPIDGPVKVWILVYVLRPCNHYDSKGNVKASAPAVPPSSPADLDKIQRAIGDAGQGIWWSNDRRIAFWNTGRCYADDGNGARMLVGFERAYVEDEHRITRVFNDVGSFSTDREDGE